jgi:hypothetical protein
MSRSVNDFYELRVNRSTADSVRESAMSEHIESLQSGIDRIRLHFAAQKVLDAGLKGHEGSFRVEDIDEKTIIQLPSYIDGFVGQKFSKIRYTEDGNLEEYGTRMAKAEDASFKLDRLWSDDITGMQNGMFSWVALPEKPPVPERRFSKAQARAGRIILVTLCFATEFVGAAISVAGADKGGNIPTNAQYISGENQEDLGIYVILGDVGVAGLVTGASLVLSAKRRKNGLPEYFVKKKDGLSQEFTVPVDEN